MRRTIVRCEACSDVFTGIYTKGGELIVRGWEGCPQCGESDLRDLASAESDPSSTGSAPAGGVAGSGRERIDDVDGPGDRIVDDGQRGRVEDVRSGRADERSTGRADD